MASPRRNLLFTFKTGVAAFLIFVATTNAALFGNNYNDHALTLVPEKSRTEGEWRASVDVLKPNRRSGLNNVAEKEETTNQSKKRCERAPRNGRAQS